MRRSSTTAAGRGRRARLRGVRLVRALAEWLSRLLSVKLSRDRSAAQVATFIREFIEGVAGDWDWDDFESVPITDPELDRIRKDAAMAGPPDPDFARLAELLRQAEALMPDQDA